MLRVAEHFSNSDTGRQRRANEDDYLARAPLFVVADGMGGARAGEVASHAAIGVFGAGPVPDGATAATDLAALAQEANKRIYALAAADPNQAGMGTTLTAAYVGENEIVLAHVGDSRAYRFRDGELLRLTEDHSLVEELMRQGKLTEEEALEHPQRSIITRALGPEPTVEVDTVTEVACAGDVYLVCSDGLTSMINESRVHDILAGAPDLGSAGRALIDAANSAGGRDNITVVLFRLDEVDAPSVARSVAQASPRREPRLPSQPTAAKRKRSLPVAVRMGIAALIVAAFIVVALFFAGQGVYFIGTDANGQIAIYNGLPYDLPGAIKLYSPYFVSGVTVAELNPAYRAKLLDNKWRSYEDASDLVRQLELQQVSGQ